MKKKLNKQLKKTSNERRSLKQEYIASFNYLRDSKWYIFFVVALFLFVTVTVFSGLQSESLNSVLMDQIKEIILEFEGLNTWQTSLKIFFNNSLASFFGIVFGIFFAIPTIIFIFINGYLIGYVSSLAVDSSGLTSLFALVPHGIFELPAVFISFGLGIRLGMFFLAKDPFQELKRGIEESMRVFVLIVIPLLVIAAIIEGILIVSFS